MGEALAARHDSVAAWFGEVSRRSGFDLSATFFGEGSPALHEDLPAQAGVFAVSVAVLDVLDAEHGLRPSAAAGYSLGTYAAYVAAGVLDRFQALDVLLEAERLLREDGRPGGMGFVIGLPVEEVEAAVSALGGASAGVAVGTENAPQQQVVSGDRGLVVEVLRALEPRALRADLLPLGRPMHSPLLEPVADRLEAFVRSRVRLRWPGTAALYAPMLGRRVGDAAEAARVLGRQLASRSRWEAVLRSLAADGHQRFVEAGPGDVLAKMLRWTLRSARPSVAEDPTSLAALAALASAAAARAPGAGHPRDPVRSEGVA